ncbi:MAG: CBS domain-containing protein [Ardenticatenaceae bacterium]|nr:CBS domain-containing protein [Ardenticatenaceae bacterium]HBY99471.1 hypothetical protein [Chloroflexota bacterium]
MEYERFYEQVQSLRERAEEDPHGAGLEALRLLEDLFYELSRERGWRSRRGGLGEYSNFLKVRDFLTEGRHARARRYADVRNCVSHRSGLLISAALTDEILDFLETLVKSGALTAEQLMSRRLHTVEPDDLLLTARDWMLHHGVNQLPVVRDGLVEGILTNRDLLLVEARPRDAHRAVAELRVANAMNADSNERTAFIARIAGYEEVIEAFRASRVVALFVSERGLPTEPLLGIITASDLLPKL